jgi:exopolyphosphatase/guanosine-5'-triphosphate,3'-diphosphate pyrophosphatase
MTHEEINRLRNKLVGSLADLQQEIRNYNCRWLIGSSGSFDTILALYRQANGMQEAPILPTNDIEIAAIPTLHHKLMNSTLEERLVNPAIPSIRAEFMPLASYLIKFVIEMQPFSRLVHSSHSLKEGMMHSVVAGLNWDKIEKEAAKHPVVSRDEGPDI